MSFNPSMQTLTLEQVDSLYVQASELVSDAYQTNNMDTLKQAIQKAQGAEQECLSHAIQSELVNLTLATVMDPIKTTKFSETAVWLAQASQSLNEKNSVALEHSIEVNLKSFADQGLLAIEPEAVEPMISLLRENFQHARLGTAQPLECALKKGVPIESTKPTLSGKMKP